MSKKPCDDCIKADVCNKKTALSSEVGKLRALNTLGYITIELKCSHWSQDYSKLEMPRMKIPPSISRARGKATEIDWANDKL